MSVFSVVGAQKRKIVRFGIYIASLLALAEVLLYNIPK